MVRRIDDSLRPQSLCFCRLLFVSRVLFVVVAVSYFVLGLGERPQARLLALAACIVVLPLVCLPVQAGSYVGWWCRGHEITEPSPPLLVLILGWVLFLVPLWVPAVARLFQQG